MFRTLLISVLLLFVTGCIEQSDADTINRAGITRVVKQINSAHNEGTLTLDQLRDHRKTLSGYTKGQDVKQGMAALGAFYTQNLDRLDQRFINLNGSEAFLITHTMVKTGERYFEKGSAFTGSNTLAALKKRQSRLIQKHNG